MPLDEDDFDDYQQDGEDMEAYAGKVRAYMEHPENFLHDHADTAYTAAEIAENIAEMAEIVDGTSAAIKENLPDPDEVRAKVQGKIEVHDHLLYDADDVEQEYIDDQDDIFYRSTKDPDEEPSDE